MIRALFLEKLFFPDIKYDFKSNYYQLCGFRSRIFEYFYIILCYFRVEKLFFKYLLLGSAVERTGLK